MKGNVTLIGMPGVGKSTVGSLLARTLGYAFLDTDALIERGEGRRLQAVVDQLGQKAFRALEEATISGLALERTVIATGGSAVYSSIAMAHLAFLGPIVWLELPYAEVEKRVALFPDRGLAIGPHQTQRNLYDERLPLYTHYATHKVDASPPPESVVAAIEAELSF